MVIYKLYNQENVNMIRNKCNKTLSYNAKCLIINGILYQMIKLMCFKSSNSSSLTIRSICVTIFFIVGFDVF